MLIYLLFFLVFLFIGSFLGVIIERIYRGEQFVSGRSYCENCKHELGALDLIPVFSYIFLNGKCRYCKKPIPPELPLIEIFTATSLTLVLYFVNTNNLVSPFAQEFFLLPYPSLLILQILIPLFITGVLILIFVTDAKYMVIPDMYLYILLALYPFCFFFFQMPLETSETLLSLKDNLIAAISLATFFALIHFGSHKKAMGEGDIYLAALIGLYLGVELSIVMWFVAFLTGALVGVILLLANKKKMKSTLPFGPFLIFGMAFALLFGAQTLNWYLSI